MKARLVYYEEGLEKLAFAVLNQHTTLRRDRGNALHCPMIVSPKARDPHPDWCLLENRRPRPARSPRPSRIRPTIYRPLRIRRNGPIRVIVHGPRLQGNSPEF